MKKTNKTHASKTEGESMVLAKIAEMPEPDRTMGEKLHSIIKTSVPTLSPRLWYGMPAYAKNGKVVCFFQNAQKFKTRYSTLGFSDQAKLDENNMWPTSYALKELTSTEEAKIAALVEKSCKLRINFAPRHMLMSSQSSCRGRGVVETLHYTVTAITHYNI